MPSSTIKENSYKNHKRKDWDVERTLLNQGSWRISAPRLWTIQGPGIAVDNGLVDRLSRDAAANRDTFHHILQTLEFTRKQENAESLSEHKLRIHIRTEAQRSQNCTKTKQTNSFHWLWLYAHLFIAMQFFFVTKN